jgi:hypothetical protein
MDMVGYSRDGKASNLPIVLTDSTLISIRKQGDGSIYHLLKGFSRCLCGMRDDATGKTFNYMHLDQKTWDEKEKHLNKKYKEET